MTDRSYRRIYLRYPMQYPLMFGWASCVGEGLLTNLSFSGCSVLCERTAFVGTEIRVGVLLPDQTRALAIEGSMIKWAEGRRFGVEFGRMSLAARQRLNRTLRQALIHHLPRHCRQSGQSHVPACQLPGGGV
jgi:hypothetical protein